MLRRARIVVFAAALAVVADFARAQEAAAEPAAGAASDAFDPQSLVGQKATLELKSGQSLADCEVQKVLPSRLPGTVASLSVAAGGSRRTFAAAQVKEVIVGELKLVFDPELKAIVDPLRRPSLAKAKLARPAGKPLAKGRAKPAKEEPPETPEQLAQRRAESEARRREHYQKTKVLLWPEPWPDEQQKALEEQKAFIAKVLAKCPPNTLQVHETDFFIYVTDIPSHQEQVSGFLQAMYEGLCGAFGLDVQKNIFRGKCVIFGFAKELTYHMFESTFFEKPVPGTQGLCHQRGEGDVVISAWCGTDIEYFANVLVHETAHGFTFRYRSAEHLPSWLDEGIADWIAQQAINPRSQRLPLARRSDAVSRKQHSSLERIRATRSMQDFFNKDPIDHWQYGLASSLIDFLIKKDPNRFRQFLETIKDGVKWQQALQQTYGATPEQLAAAYGQFMGIPGLVP